MKIPLDTADTTNILAAEQLTEAQQEKLAQVLDQYVNDIESGKEVSPSQVAWENPDIADALGELLDGLQLLNNLNGSPDNRKSSPGDRRGKLPGVHRLGTYELGEVIGQGAMGVVYRARDIENDREVALKVLALGSSLEHSRIERFRREAKAAASLDHPNVVPVYGVGYSEGIHYYAMQLIDGESLDRRITAARLIRANAVDRADICKSASPLLGEDRYVRIASLCAAAAGALHAAHEAGIIHRDVKPSNLVLGNDGQLWVADFGLARVQAENGLTKTGELVGTIRYMSPEQANGQGDLIDARSDVYALGTTLFELLALVPAYPGEDSMKLLRDIRSSEPPTLSSIEPGVPRDLEIIVQRSMRPRPADRYRTAAAMAKDLQRFVAGKPVRAHGVSPIEKAIAWARRHRQLAYSLFAVWCISLIAAFTTTLLVIREQSLTADALRIKDEHFRQARSAVDALAETASRLSDFPEADAVRHDVLSKTMRYYDQFIESNANDPRFPLDVVRTRHELARLVALSGRYEEADGILATALEELAQLNGGRHSGQAGQLFVRISNERGLMASQQGQHERAVRQLDACFAWLNEVRLNETMADAQLRGLLAITHNNRGVVLLRNGQTDESLESLQAAIRIWDTASDPSEFTGELSSELSAELADGFSNLSALLSEMGRAEEAIHAGTRSLSIREKLLDVAEQEGSSASQAIRLGAALDDAEQFGRLAVTCNNLAALHWRTGRTQEAIACYQRAVHLLERSMRSGAAQQGARNRLAVTLNNLGMAFSSAAAHDEACEIFRRAIVLAKSACEANPSNDEAAQRLAGIYNNLGVALRSTQRIDLANEYFQRACDLLDRPASSRADGQLKMQVQANLMEDDR